MKSLIEKLKEGEDDPSSVLPPSSWESIPSQNVSFSSHQSPPPLRYQSSSSVSEASLVRLAMNALQGLESSLITIQKLSAAFSADSADRSHLQIPSLWTRSSSTCATADILNSFGRFGFLVFLLQRFVHHFRHCNNDSFSLVNQAFAVAVSKVLEGYLSGLNTVQASSRFRHSFEVEFDAESSCHLRIVHSKLTLLELYLHTKELSSQIEALANVCNLYDTAACFSVSSVETLTAEGVSEFSNFHRGGDLLTYLYMQLQVADPLHCAMLKFLFLRSCEPYFGFIRSWIFLAETGDPYKEFIVESQDNVPPDLFCNSGILSGFPLAKIRDGVSVPYFLKDFLIPIIRAGQQLQVLMKLLELCSRTDPGGHSYEDFLPSFRRYLSDNLYHASSMTFSKGHLEDMVTMRNTYYSKLQEKLGNLLTKLEFRYQQVVPAGALTIYSENSCQRFNIDGLNVSSKPDKLTSPLTNDNGGSNFSTIGDELCALDTSECSSLSDSEELTLMEQLTAYPDNLVGQQELFFSSLSCPSSSSIDNTLQKSTPHERSHHMECNLPENFPKDYGFQTLVQSDCQEKASDHMFMSFGLDCLNLTYDGNFSGKSKELGIINKPLCDDELSSYWGMPQCNTAREINRADVESVNEHLLNLEKLDSAQVCPIVLGEDSLEADLHANAAIALDPRGNVYSNNILSRNPMLRKAAFFKPKCKPGQKHSSNCGQSVPCFDFSTVEDPCKIYVERSAVNSKRIATNNEDVSDTAAKFHSISKQDSGEYNILINNSKMTRPCLPLYSKEQGQEALLSSETFGGRRWESLLSNFRFTDGEIIGEHKESLLAMFEIPLDIIIDKCMLQEILVQYKYVSKLAIKILEGFDMHEHFLALRRYYFMEVADWADLFITSLWHNNWGAAGAEQRVAEIQGFLELSVQRSSCEYDTKKDRLYAYVKENSAMPHATSAIGIHSFDFLGLGYYVEWPVNIILTPSALKHYSSIFGFLLKVKLAVFALTDVWRLFKDFVHLISKNSHSGSHQREVLQLNLLIKMRLQINHFVSTLQQYVHSQLSHVSWCRFLHSLKYKVNDMVDLELMHMEYLTNSLHICFLSDETRTVTGPINSILQCALDFRSCLATSMWDLGLVEEGLLDKLSRINMSQVLAIKQKFNKSLKELLICNLKSPKHVKFGLSSFWDHLNYNEYLPDDEMHLCYL